MSAHAPPTLEQWVADGIATLDAVGSTQAVVLAASEASPVALLMAATHSERISAVVLVNGFARVVVGDDYPEGVPAEFVEGWLDATNPTRAPGYEEVAQFAPSAAADEQFRQWWHETGRRGASPSTARALLRVALESDVRAVLPTIRVPALVAYLRDGPASSGSQYLGAHIAGATLVEVPGADDYWWASDVAREVLDEIEEFLTGVRRGPEPDRVLATVLFTDMVGSTEKAAAVGDRRWREVLEAHHAAVRRELERFRGREIDTAGDGFLAAFDGPARGVRCAEAIVREVRRLDLEVRAGLHTGECESVGDRLSGIAVHTGARVASLAGAGEVLVSSTVKDLVAGSGITFEDRGIKTLKGVPGEWHLYAVAPG